MGPRSDRPAARQGGAARGDGIRALVFSSLRIQGSWSEGGSKTRFRVFSWFNKIESKGRWSRSAGGETRTLQCLVQGRVPAREPRLRRGGLLGNRLAHQTQASQGKAPGLSSFGAGLKAQRQTLKGKPSKRPGGAGSIMLSGFYPPPNPPVWPLLPTAGFGPKRFRTCPPPAQPRFPGLSGLWKEPSLWGKEVWAPGPSSWSWPKFMALARVF